MNLDLMINLSHAIYKYDNQNMNNHFDCKAWYGDDSLCQRWHAFISIGLIYNLQHCVYALIPLEAAV